MRRGCDRYACDKCPMRFIKKSLYDAHVRRHMGLKAFKCEHCDEEFQTAFNFKTHMEVNHYDKSNGKPEYICGVDECGKTYNRKVYRHSERLFSFNISTINMWFFIGFAYRDLSFLTFNQFILDGKRIVPKGYANSAEKYSQIMRD